MKRFRLQILRLPVEDLTVQEMAKVSIVFAFLACTLPRLVAAGGDTHVSAEEAHAAEAHDSEETPFCAYFTADALDDAVDGVDGLAHAVQSCSAGKPDCVNAVLLTLSGFFESGAASLRAAGCFQKKFGGAYDCTANILDIAGGALAIGSEAKALANGACDAHAGGHHRRLGGHEAEAHHVDDVHEHVAEHDEEHATVQRSSHYGNYDEAVKKGPGLQCAASSAKVLLPLTKMALFLAFQASHCDPKKHPENWLACVVVGLEQVALSAKIAGDVVGIVDACAHPEGFMAHCGFAITEIVDEAADLTVAALGAIGGCGPHGADAHHLRLFDADMIMPPVATEKRSMFDVLPWAISGLLFFMIPIAFRAGKSRSRAPKYSASLQPSSHEELTVE